MISEEAKFPGYNRGDARAVDGVTTPFRPSDISLTTPPMNLGDLIDMIEAGWVNFDTRYQRGEDLWSPDKQSRLIESVLLGLRLPAFYFEEVSKRSWNIIDGLQRCCAIRNFCVTKTLRLSGLEFLADQFDGRDFSELNFETRRDIRMLPITVNVLTKGTPTEVKYILFQRLNTGGMTLTPQEIRTAMFQGRPMEVLERLATSPEFIDATRGKVQTKRQDDRDFISRFVAFYLRDYHDYRPKLDGFINRAMEMLREGLSEDDIRKMEFDFLRAMRAAVAIFGEYAFRRCRVRDQRPMPPLNKACFEVVAVTFAKLCDAELEMLVARKELLNQHVFTLMNQEVFWRAFSGGTSKRESVLRRFNGFALAVEKTLEGYRGEIQL